jgi:hypothetical protein
MPLSSLFSRRFRVRRTYSAELARASAVSFVQRFGSALNAEDVAVTNDRVRPDADGRVCPKQTHRKQEDRGRRGIDHPHAD